MSDLSTSGTGWLSAPEIAPKRDRCGHQPTVWPTVSQRRVDQFHMFRREALEPEIEMRRLALSEFSEIRCSKAWTLIAVKDRAIRGNGRSPFISG